MNLPANVTPADIDDSATLPPCDVAGCGREMDRHLPRFLGQPARNLCEQHYQIERECRADDLQIERERTSPLFGLMVAAVRFHGKAVPR